MTHADTIRDIETSVKRCPECGLRFGEGSAFCPFDGKALVRATWDKAGDPLTGKRIDGRYEVLEPLGEGGMGTVYRVRHVTLDRLFAMKVLRRDLADDDELARRFVHEAKATAAVKHPGVVQITDFGELADRSPYFVMELLVGETLATRIRARGPLAPLDAVKVARKIAEALEASHAAGVVHRDLKPDNVFLVGRALGRAAEDELRVVDFGAARVVGASRLTKPGVVFGTPYYMSPEQASGQAVDARADVYSLGVLLYEMVTGTLPFEADTYMGVLTKHMFAKPAKPSERVSSGIQLGPLEGVILRMLEKDPAARFASMTEASAALAAAQAGRAVAPAPAVARGGTLAMSARSGSATEEIRGLRRELEAGASKAERIQVALEKQLADEAAHRRRAYASVAIGAAVTTVVLGGAAFWALSARGARPAAELPASTSASATPSSSAPRGPETPSAPSGEASAAPSATAVVVTGTPVEPEPRAGSAPAPAGKGARPGPSGPSATASPASSATGTPRSIVDPHSDFPDPWKR